MKLLFYKWNSFMNEGVEKGLEQLNIAYDTFFFPLKDWEKDAEFMEVFTNKVKERVYDVVFSINYVPMISDICEIIGIQYVAWVYDSPIHIKDISSLKNTCNKIYFFDRGQVEKYRKDGIEANYMSLAVDTYYWKRQIRKNKNKIFNADVSFVGQLYQTEYSYFLSPMDEYVRGFLEGIINSQRKVYGAYLIPELVTGELLQRMNEQYAKVAVDGFQMGKRELEFLLASEVTFRERYETLALLAKHFQVHWYTSDNVEISNIKKHMYADYNTQMPVIFHNSKINLNISLKTIYTGIPLRALDIMGCAGFLLSNYQVELAEYFVPGEECILYESLGDMYEKCVYYLVNETERQKIALAGYEKVKRDFTFKEQLAKMFI